MQLPFGYQIRIYANHLDTRFCPIHWLFFHWHLAGIYDRPKTGPILQDNTQANYRKDLKKLFEKCGFKYTSYSVCRSAAQWGRRCGADLVVLRNIGCWVSFRSLLYYIAEAEKEARKAIRNNNNVDPIFRFWFFDTDAMEDTMDKPSNIY